MGTEITLEHNFYDIEDSGDILGLAKSLVNGRHPGILATVDANGSPRLRWMSTLSCEAFPVFHSLTAPNSRKVREILRHPAVHWMFFNADKTLVLNLTGWARIIEETALLKQIWRKIVDTSHAYFLNEYAEKPGFVAIETTVEAIECSSPGNALRFEIDPAGLVRAPNAWEGRHGGKSGMGKETEPPL
ncbi:MAG: pyridoxamine 5-phosphate oxidase-related FMN-binding protein [Verrucomicrobiales bacterium]|nr:pyridoxamine 5-phosphate oxidase-related FMN-binding protein [Verrucomicrobiales bacterium]